MAKLTTSAEHYIRAIFELSFKEEGIRVSDIAVRLKVTKASVCTAMRSLETQNMIYRDGERLVYLTSEGAYQAILILDKFSIIRKFLTEILGMEDQLAEEEARAIESVIRTETICAICRYLDRDCTDSCSIKADSDAH